MPGTRLTGNPCSVSVSMSAVVLGGRAVPGGNFDIGGNLFSSVGTSVYVLKFIPLYIKC